jgi:hypothetical protein
MKRNGLTTVDDYSPAHWDKQQAKRNEIAAGNDSSRRHDIARAIAQIQEKRR